MDGYDEKRLASMLPFPADDANKYSRGKLIIFAGSSQYPGAAILCAWASQRAGAGYTQVFTSPSTVPLVQAARPSLVVGSSKNVLRSDFIAVRKDRPCAYVVGPGCEGTRRSTHSTTKLVLERAKAAVLVDGGALHALSSLENRALLSARKVGGFDTIITPHGGEAMKLAKPFGLPTDNPAQLCYGLSLAYDAITVLKGPDTFISDGEKIFSLSQGTAALAKAGTGDVLSGIIGAFLAQGLASFDAVVLGVCLHAKAGSHAEDNLTAIAVTAEDVIEYIPSALKELAISKE